MALIGKIRNLKWLLVGTIAGALILFIVQLMFDQNTNQLIGSDSASTIGNFEGKKLDNSEFSRTYDMLYGSAATDGYNERASLWNFYMDEAIVQKEAEAIGLGVSKTELLELQFSEDPSKLSPIISSRYQNPTTRQLDRDQLNQLKDLITNNKIDEQIKAGQLVQDFKYRWAHQEKEIVKERLQTKMIRMVEKAMYTPTWQAEMIAAEQNQKVDFLYVQVPFDEIQNAEVSLTDDDYKAYFDENKALFKQTEETRKVEYVAFDVKPTAKDSTNLRQAVANLIEGFRTAENDSLFVENNYGSIDEAYVKKDALSAAIADTIGRLQVGEVFGPYVDQNSFKAVKLLGKKSVPDSVKARHILRRASDMATLTAAQKTIDSLKNLIETGVARFDSLAPKFSEDQSNAGKGGDLGFFGPGTMVKEFNDVCFYKAEPGKVYSVVTQFGVHLIEVTDRKYTSTEPGFKVAYIAQEIVPSQETQDGVREQALQLQESSKNLEELRKNAAAKGLTAETSPSLKANEFTVGNLGAGHGSRSMIRWAFGADPNVDPAKIGDVSPEIYSFQNQGQFYVSKFVVAGLKAKMPKGIPSWKDVKDEIEPMVINRKKAEVVKAKIGGQTDLAAIGGTYGVAVDTALNVTFGSAFIQKAGGAEPKVVATALGMDLNQVSAPIAGNTGIFIVKPTNKPAADGAPAANMAQIRQSSQMSARGMARNRLIQTLRDNADVKDNRSRFF